MKHYIIQFKCPTRGFFSIYLQAIRCIDFAVSNNFPFYVDLSESNSLYTDVVAFEGNKNIWDYYFVQVKPPTEPVIFSTAKYEGSVDKIWWRSHFKRVHNKAVKHIRYTENMQTMLDQRKKSFPKAVVGVHIRKTDHHTEVPEVALEQYIKLLRRIVEKRSFKNIFVATDDATILAVIKSEFASLNVFSNTVHRSNNGQAVHKNEDYSDKYLLGAEAILDAYSLSLCDELILSNSNLSYCALYFNPNAKYHLLDGFNTSWIKSTILNFYYANRYILFHQYSVIQLHRKLRYFFNSRSGSNHS